ncbi:MAG: sialidase family protein [Acidimicrobiales bacterium]
MAVATGLALVAATPGPAQESGAPTVTPSVQVTDDVTPGRVHTEPQVLVHPEDPGTVVIVEAEFVSSTCQVHVSRDGGRTWALASGRPTPPQYRACSRPTFGPFEAAGFGVDGTLYVAGAGSETSGGRGPTDAFLARSTDLGESWDFTIIDRSSEEEFTAGDGSSLTALQRYEYIRMAVHPSDPNRVYVGWRYRDAQGEAPPRSLVAVSTDRGRSFAEPADIMAATFSRDEVQGSDVPALAVAEDGTIYAFTKERPPSAPPPPPGAPSPPEPQRPSAPPVPANTCQTSAAFTTTTAAPEATEAAPQTTTTARPGPGQPGAGARLLMARSTDDGATWEASVVDDSGLACVPCLTTPEAEVDPTTGDLYVVFEQSGSPPPNARDDRDIWFLRSSDGGETWSERLRVNDDEGGHDQMFPGISIAPNGRIDLAWHDFRTDALYNPEGTGRTDRSEVTCWDVFFTYSTDGGRTWASNLRVSDRSMNQYEGYAFHPLQDLRGPMGVASTDRATLVAWADSRNGRVDLPTEDAYAATVAFGPGEETEPAVKATSLGLGVAVGLVGAGLLLVAFVRLRPASRRSGEATTASS